MKLRFTIPAAEQLDQALGYIAERNPRGASNVQRRIQTILELLLEHPQVGLLTRTPGLRRIIAVPYPYAIFYRVIENEIIIASVRHTARKPFQR